MNPFAGLVHESWLAALSPYQDLLTDIGRRLRADGRPFHPAGEQILRAFQTPLTAVKVLVIGQDPYPTPGHAVGLSFSVPRSLRPLPRSLDNIFKELSADLGIEPSEHGDLQNWVDQGVLLLNRVLTVASGEAGSHRSLGWQSITEAAVRALGEREEPMVAILWGNDARQVQGWLGDHPVIASAHPSPLSAARGFFGSRPFSRANAELERLGLSPIDWALPQD